MAIQDSYNFRRVNERLTTSGVVGRDRLAGLSAEGYQIVINLLPDSNEQAVAGEREIVELQGLTYVYIPVDFQHPTPADFEGFATAMDQTDAQKTHIHCAANYRVSAFYGRYAVRAGYWRPDQARAFILDLWQPDQYPGWTDIMAGIDNPPDR